MAVTVGSTILPHANEELGSIPTGAGPFNVEFAYSPCVSVFPLGAPKTWSIRGKRTFYLLWCTAVKLNSRPDSHFLDGFCTTRVFVILSTACVSYRLTIQIPTDYNRIKVMNISWAREQHMNKSHLSIEVHPWSSARWPKSLPMMVIQKHYAALHWGLNLFWTFYCPPTMVLDCTAPKSDVAIYLLLKCVSFWEHIMRLDL